MRPRNEQGYALVAAVTAVAVFAYVAFQVLAANQGGIALVAGRVQQARLSAAADAGISLALHGLSADDRGARWSIDGRPRRLEFDGVDLTVTVEDERGKAPLAGLSDGQARALFAGAGATGDQLDALVREFREWQTEDNTLPDPNASLLPPPAGPPVRHGPFRTVGELAGLKDMDSAIFARIAPVVTVFFENSGPFEASHAQPLAKAAMRGDDLANPDQLANEASINNQTPDEELAPDDRYIGRTLTIRVIARDEDGARTHRMEIVEMTGDKVQPYWVRYAE
jgi:general secretion pathway protein K